MKHSDSTEDLRARALKRLKEQEKAGSPPAEAPPQDTTRLVHDLRVHEIELELQNEELRNTQTELLRTREKYFNLYDRAPVGYCTVSPDGTILELNQTLARMFGGDPRSLTGQNLSKFAAADDADQLYFLLKSLRETGQAPSASFRMLDATGRTFWTMIETSLMENDEERGQVIHLAISNVTNERKNEAIRIAAKVTSLETLAGGIAHDFNNLLGGLFGYIALARELCLDVPAVLRYLDKATSVYQRAKNLTHQLMAFTRGNLPVKKTQALGPVVEKSASLTLSGTETQFKISVPADLWPASFDENQISQVLDNLLLNATQAMPQGGTVQIRGTNTVLEPGNPHLLTPGRYVELSVSDTGTGISVADSTKVFDPFFTTKKTGHGLGLATCHAIIKKHDGALWVESVEGQGSTFHFLVPTTSEEALVEREIPQTGHRGTGTILVMDDEDFYREILAALLQGMGYEVIETTNGDDALAAFRSLPTIRAAILDLTVPGGKGGKDIIRALRSDHPDLPVIACSGFSEGPVIARPEEFGFTASLQKPFLPIELDTLMYRHLG